MKKSAPDNILYEIALAEVATYKGINTKLKKKVARLMVTLSQVELIAEKIIDGKLSPKMVSKINEIIKREREE